MTPRKNAGLLRDRVFTGIARAPQDFDLRFPFVGIRGRVPRRTIHIRQMQVGSNAASRSLPCLSGAVASTIA